MAEAVLPTVVVDSAVAFRDGCPLAVIRCTSRTSAIRRRGEGKGKKGK